MFISSLNNSIPFLNLHNFIIFLNIQTRQAKTYITKYILLVNTSKYVLFDAMTPVFSIPGPEAVTLEGSPAAPSTLTLNGLLLVSLPPNLMIT